jgi:dipeptidyl aminopeptidase/acylaminoacyl peptidase
MKARIILFFSGLFLCSLAIMNAQEAMTYQTPSKEIAQLVDAPLPPVVSVNATKDWMLLIHRPGYPSIEELAQPELRLAGLRMNPRTNGSSRGYSYNGLTLKNIQSGKEYEVKGLPEKLQIENVDWSPDGQRIAFTLTRNNAIELWHLDVAGQEAKALTEGVINDAMGAPFEWMPDSKHLLVKTVLEGRGEAPEKPDIPSGPVIQQSSGQETTLRTWQDLLQNPYDESVFEYYASAQLHLLNLDNGEMTKFGPAGIIRSFDPSPDGKYVMISSIQKPFSYLVPYRYFPTTYDILDIDGKAVKRLADLPLIDKLPKGFGSVPTGPRSIGWRPDQPATAYWVEAQDGGDPSVETDVRDRLFYLPAPFDGEKTAGIPFKLRYSGIDWGDDQLAIAYEYWFATRQLITSKFVPGKADSKEVLFDYSAEDRYGDPGSFATAPNQYGRNVLLTSKDGNHLFLTGQGASPQGDRPFLREFDLTTKETKEYWRSEAPYYERPTTILDVDKSLIITSRESKTENPNYYIRNWKNGKLKALTEFEHPYPGLKGIEKQVVKYKRKDGVDLQGDLYLPKGFRPGVDDPLPVIMWAYPREYKSAADASQVSGSPYQFLRLSWGSPICWVTKGYAVFDRASMPIVGEGDKEPNDSFRKQLVDNAEAAVEKLVEMKVADRGKIAVGGHSYGAFMTANLLAHSDLFAAGIARSGAYNRTLTPFGFQREERTYWDAPEIYYTMSPFMHADKINEPMLMIHGEADNNSGTFPVQSKRMYSAINGLGGMARLVMLPHESHGYRARESVMHMFWEMDQWLEKYVKNRKAVP